ncbi:hypothetical protein [Leptospira sp. GIMC2001]|uniref:hypothetical protein n=1 Tax=Leptospira sp. GIMC2001 TaxID=1513297 RepID=UPI00234A7FF1|nr:hypothetical protein [Leptospira sp. GIMC2001]WCL47895.1 hypothetical protein O4O04_11230 [Leptospira sp. GIMC2001]
MRKFSLFTMIIVAQFAVGRIQAEEVQGLVQEFLEVEDYLSKKKPSPEARKKILEKNLLDSVRNTLSRKISAPATELKNLKVSELSYERPANTNKFYIKYKNYYMYYSFSMEPEIYLQLPQEEILYVKPASFDKEAPHKEESAALPDVK